MGMCVEKQNEEFNKTRECRRNCRTHNAHSRAGHGKGQAQDCQGTGGVNQQEVQRHVDDVQNNEEKD